MGDPTAAPTSDGRGARLTAAAGEIWERYRGQILDRVGVIEKAAIAILEGTLQPAERREAEREAHRLAGSVGTFGFQEASRLARRAEQILMGSTAVPEAAIVELSEIAVALRRELTQGPVAASNAAAESSGQTLWLIGSQGKLIDEITMEAEARGNSIECFLAPQEAARALGSQAPDAIALDLTSIGPNGGSAAAITPLTAAPTLVLDAPDRFDNRLEAARAGAIAYLTLPRTAATVVDTLEEIGSAALAGTKILAVSDDPAALASVEGALTAIGAGVETLADPHDFWAKIQKYRPELVILAARMADIDGLDLCRVLRADPQWSAVPIIFLTRDHDAATLSALLEAGGNDHIPEPVEPAVLVRRASALMVRRRHLGVRGGSDPLTGVSTPVRFREQAERLLHVASRKRDPVTFLLLKLDDLRTVNRSRGSATGDDVLRDVARRLQKTTRDGDAVGRRGGAAFMLAMYGTTKDSAVARIEKVLSGLRDEGVAIAQGEHLPVTFSGGVAAYPADGGDLATLVQAAETALDAAQHEGGDRLSIFGAPADGGAGTQHVDVLLVEDDPILARLLLHTLEENGLTHHWISNGREAAEALTGDSPKLTAAVVLLDIDLPGLDGFGVLRAIRDVGSLDSTRVIMLTVRAREDEIVRALGGGAFDHMAKPVSIPILLQRVQRALNV